MNLNPYRHSPEHMVLNEAPSWEECREVKVQRDEALAEVSALRLRYADRGPTTGRCIHFACSDDCDREATFPLCVRHLRDAYTAQVRIWAARHATEPESVPDDIREALDHDNRPWVVYYIKMGDRVKIGRTVNLTQRMKTFSAHPDQLLAVEPGVKIDGIDRETQRHREFAEWRVKRTELFEMSQPVLDHIAAVVSMFGDPQRHLSPTPA